MAPWCFVEKLSGYQAHTKIGSDSAAQNSLLVDLRATEHRQIPLALAKLHRDLPVDAEVRLVMALTPPDVPNAPDPAELVVGAGFTMLAASGATRRPKEGSAWQSAARRERSLADRVGPGMRILVCGLNPSPYAADRGIAFGRPGNRFWPALLGAGLASRDRDPDAALAEHGIGFTDLVKRTTRTAAEISPWEYRAGAERVEHLVRWLEPGVVCFLGLSGYRAAIEHRAVAGVLPGGFGERPAVLLGNPSGLNAHLSVAQLILDLQSVARLAAELPVVRRLS